MGKLFSSIVTTNLFLEFLSHHQIKRCEGIKKRLNSYVLRVIQTEKKIDACSLPPLNMKENICNALQSYLFIIFSLFLRNFLLYERRQNIFRLPPPHKRSLCTYATGRHIVQNIFETFCTSTKNFVTDNTYRGKSYYKYENKHQLQVSIR